VLPSELESGSDDVICDVDLFLVLSFAALLTAWVSDDEILAIRDGFFKIEFTILLESGGMLDLSWCTRGRATGSKSRWSDLILKS
jgi:hypothetical protein